MRLYSIFFLLILASCTELPKGVRNSLLLAGDNEPELRKVIQHYSTAGDKQKYRAACYLIEHMKWHFTTGEIIDVDSAVIQRVMRTDSLYYSLAQNKTWQEQSEDNFKEHLTMLHRNIVKPEIDTTKYNSPFVKSRVRCDLETVDFDFLVSHIDNAFEAWMSSPHAQHLTFDEFCEFMLPYKTFYGLTPNYTGAHMRAFFDRYMHSMHDDTLVNIVGRYNRAVLGIKELNGNNPVMDGNQGFYDLLFKDKIDCSANVHYAALTMRAYGLPVTAVTTIGHRELNLKHSFCTLYDSSGNWQAFNAESQLPDTAYNQYSNTLSLYQYTFAPQKNTPYFLKNKSEQVPAFFSHPFLKNVTSNFFETAKITLPLPEKYNNKLIYLYTIENVPGGLTPVMWGTINGRNAKFDDIMYEVVYFPIVIDNYREMPVGDPFYVVKTHGGYDIITLTTNEDELLNNVVLKNKFPRKPNMIKAAEQLVGGRIIASNDNDFRSFEILYVINDTMAPVVHDIDLDNNKAFKFYRFIPPEDFPKCNISVMQFLTLENISERVDQPIAPLAIYCEQDREGSIPTGYKRISGGAPDLADWDRNAFDAVMSNGPYWIKTITFIADVSAVATKMRLAPLNADNGIKPGHSYELFYWDGGWHSLGQKMAEYNALEYRQIPSGKLYWLHSDTDGKEEMPFFIEDGKQRFLYDNICGIMPYEYKTFYKKR